MMKKYILGTILIGALMSGCSEETLSSDHQTLKLQGTEIVCFDPLSRGNPLLTSLPAGCKMTLYSQGGIQSDGLLFSYDGNNWEGDDIPVWTDTPQEAQIQSYCPPLYREHQSFYQEGKLHDQLYAQITAPYKHSIKLSFKHLFSHIIFNVSKPLNNQVQQIEFIPSKVVTGVIPETGAVLCDGNSTPFILEKTNSGTYDFLIAPTALSITIRIHTDTGKTYESTLEEYPFESGHEYTCPVRQTGQTSGISTVEDFIAFTHLINGENYEGRSLEEFGERTGENMTYYLLNDLVFTADESSRIQMIGKYGTDNYIKEKFEDVFDGQGHSLKNLQYEKDIDGYDYYGLFSGISSGATVKNLTIQGATYDSPKGSKKSSFLVGINKGKIENCHIIDCELKQIDKAHEFGSITSRNEGIIVNCHVDNFRLKAESIQGNGITRSNYGGKILNCAVTDCNINKASSGGLICTRTRNGTILNCYVAGSASSAGKCNPICLVAEEENLIRRCFYPQSHTKAPVGTNYESLPSDSLMKYGNLQSVTEEALPQVLNQWVQGSGTQSYPDLHFLLWEKGESLPAVFVSP